VERKRKVLMAEGFDTKLRIIRRHNLLISQHFLYIYREREQYIIVMVEIIA
jgi:hypothetical protein